MNESIKEYRCTFCKKLLFKGLLIESVIEIKCRSCQTMNIVESSRAQEFICLVSPCPYRKKI
ncbi:MAG: Com family DNA-binding transcriptional regulator [Candidatus Magasanikbacteria bacterium]|nr:Com family DNA-binding transcriptional regulator [Candidatus Magasanikbacteria bacterium]